MQKQNTMGIVNYIKELIKPNKQSHQLPGNNQILIITVHWVYCRIMDQKMQPKDAQIHFLDRQLTSMKSSVNMLVKKSHEINTGSAQMITEEELMH